jgi:hypothetical protein
MMVLSYILLNKAEKFWDRTAKFNKLREINKRN